MILIALAFSFVLHPSEHRHLIIPIKAVNSPRPWVMDRIENGGKGRGVFARLCSDLYPHGFSSASLINERWMQRPILTRTAVLNHAWQLVVVCDGLHEAGPFLYPEEQTERNIVSDVGY